MTRRTPGSSPAPCSLAALVRLMHVHIWLCHLLRSLQHLHPAATIGLLPCWLLGRCWDELAMLAHGAMHAAPEHQVARVQLCAPQLRWRRPEQYPKIMGPTLPTLQGICLEHHHARPHVCPDRCCRERCCGLSCSLPADGSPRQHRFGSEGS